MDYKIGDSVQAGGGGPILTIEGLSANGETAKCSWWNKGRTKRMHDDFQVAILRKVERFAIGAVSAPNPRFSR